MGDIWIWGKEKITKHRSGNKHGGYSGWWGNLCSSEKCCALPPGSRNLELKKNGKPYRMRRTDSLEKTLMLGKIEGRKRRRAAEDEMVGWHYWLNGLEFEQAPGVGDGQGSLVCCSPWGGKELDMTERLNWIGSFSKRTDTKKLGNSKEWANREIKAGVWLEKDA